LQVPTEGLLEWILVLWVGTVDYDDCVVFATLNLLDASFYAKGIWRNIRIV
jgi:hypothetical protein